MNKITSMLEKYIEPLMEKINSYKLISALKNGTMFMTPFLIFGGIVLIITNFPGLDKIAPDLATWLDTNLGQLSTVTIGFMGLVMIIGVASAYSKELKINEIYGTITALLSYMVVTLFSSTQEVLIDGATQTATLNNVIPTDAFGSRAMITGIIVAIVSVRIFAWVYHKNLVIKMPESVPPMVTNAFTSVFPASISLVFFVIVRIIFMATPYGSLTECIYTLITLPLMGIGNNIFSFLLITQIFANILWFFGIHGTNVVNSVWSPILTTMGVANLEAFQAGKDLPYIISNSFNSVYGITSVYVIAIAMLIVMRSKRMRGVAKVSTLPAVFCISEPMVFGLPIFMNPILFIPYLLCSSVQLGLAYVLCVIGFAPVPVIPTPWTCPVFINALLSTNWNFMGVITQIILIVVGVLIWLPFMKLLDKSFLKDEQEESVSNIADFTV